MSKEREGYQKRTEHMQRDLNEKRTQVDLINQQQKQFLEYKNKTKEL